MLIRRELHHVPRPYLDCTSVDPTRLIFEPPAEHVRSALMYIERMASAIRGIDPDARDFYHRILARLGELEGGVHE